MVDRAHVKGAERILARAKARGFEGSFPAKTAEHLTVSREACCDGCRPGGSDTHRYSAALSFNLAIASSTEGRSMANIVSGVTTA